MSDLESFVRERLAGEAQHAPLAHDLARAARDRVHRQRRRAAGAVAIGLTVLVLVVVLGWAFGDATRTGAPPADDTTATAAPAPSTAAPEPVAPTVTPPADDGRAVAKNVVLNTWLEGPNDFSNPIAAVPWGGRIYCTTEVVAASADGDDLYVRALCSQMYAKSGTAVEGSGESGPLVMHVAHHADADGTEVVDRVTGITVPRTATYNADIGRLFPAGIIKRLVSGTPYPPDGPDIVTRAQADIDAGRLGAPTDGRVIAARFLAYADAQKDSPPIDTPVRLYLGNRYQKTIRPDRDGRSAWDLCVPGYAARTCPMSAIAALSSGDILPSITHRESRTCLAEAPDPPVDTGGTRSVMLRPQGADCVSTYVVRIWFNDVGQITAVNLTLGEP
jgi:hypothetical protein